MDAKTTFKQIVNDKINRDGIKDLMVWLEETDFYTAPASTKYHSAYEGGLITHSLNVYKQLEQLVNIYQCETSMESVAITALFHDLCKVDYYKTCMRWRKDENNKWEQYPTYITDEDCPFGGHGSKSVYLIQRCMPLLFEEASAINCHMGAWDSTKYSNPSNVYKSNKLAWLLHVADEAATYFLDF